MLKFHAILFRLITVYFSLPGQEKCNHPTQRRTQIAQFSLLGYFYDFRPQLLNFDCGKVALILVYILLLPAYL